MNESQLSYLIDPLREMLYQFDSTLERYRSEKGVELALLSCSFIPQEIISTFDIVPLKLPSLFCDGKCYDSKVLSDFNLKGLYSYMILPQGCTASANLISTGIKASLFKNPTGYGEEASVSLHNEIASLLSSLKNIDIKNIDIKKLQTISKEHNNLRRIIRGISAVRRNKPWLISNRDLEIIFEAAQVFPPELVFNYVDNILKSMNKDKSESRKYRFNALVYSSMSGTGDLFDEIEELGFIVAEDDSCNGRRNFDLSVNPESEYIYYELLDAFSYRPLCPSIRSVEERYELLYKLIKNHGIDPVLFLKGQCCKNKIGHIDYLRIKLMRDGIDPLVIESDELLEGIKEYMKKAD